MAKKKKREEEYEDDDEEEYEDEEEIDEDEDEEDEEDPTLPPGVLVASILWMITGGLILLGMLVMVVSFAAGGNAPEGQPQADGAYATGQVIGMVVAGLFGAVFVMVGIQSIQGTAKDTLGNGIGSIILGLLYILIGLVIAISGQKAAPIIAAIQLLLGFGLMFAGILALVSREPYVEFARFTQKKKIRKKKRRR